MKVILKQTVPKVGKEGSVVNVADGFARNYLFPRGLAIAADKNQLEVVRRRREKLASAEAGTLAGAEALKAELDGKTVRIEGKAGHETFKLFGAVTSQDIVEAIRKQLGQDVDKRRIALIDPIKRLGAHEVHLDLHREVDAVITVEVFDPAAPKVEELSEHLPELDAEIAGEAPAERKPEPEPVEA